MTITIEQPAATEERLRAQATATGKNISTFVVEAVEARLALAHLQLKDVLAPVHDEFKQSGMSETELNALLETELKEVRSERRTHRGSAT